MHFQVWNHRLQVDHGVQSKFGLADGMPIFLGNHALTWEDGE